MTDIYTEENLCETLARFLILKLRWQMLWRWAKHIVQFLFIFALGSCSTSYFDRLQVSISYQLVKSIYTFSSYSIKQNAHNVCYQFNIVLAKFKCTLCLSILSVKWHFKLFSIMNFLWPAKILQKTVWQYLALWHKKRKHILSLQNLWYRSTHSLIHQYIYLDWRLQVYQFFYNCHMFTLFK